LKKSKYVKNVFPDFEVKANLMDSVPMIGAPYAWDLGITGINTTIAIIDTGIDYTHPDLGGCFGINCKVVDGYDFVNMDNDPIDDMGHGTHCAGIAAGNGSGSFNPPTESSFYFYRSNIGSSPPAMLDVDLKDGLAHFGILYGDYNNEQFLGTGQRINKRLKVSDTNSILFDEDTDEYFVVSWSDGVNSESYQLSLTNFEDDFNKNRTSIENHVTGGYECGSGTEEGEFCEIGNIVLTISNIDPIGDSALVTINSGGRFDKIYDSNGYYINLPLERDFPTSTYSISVYDSSGVVKQNSSFYFEYGEMQVISGSGGGGGGGGTGSYSLKGVAPDAKLYSYKVLDSEGSGSTSDVIAGIERAVDPNKDGNFNDKVDVISMSLGGGGNPDGPDSIAVDNAVNSGVVVVVAAGNDGPSEQSIGSPGVARKALTVGAVNKKGTIADFSSRGPVVWTGGSLIKPDVVAPGVKICAAQFDNAFEEDGADGNCNNDNNHVAISGTSMATPHVAGVAALVKQAHPELNAEEIKSLIEITSIDLGYPVNVQGNGLVSVRNALNSNIILSESKLNFENFFGDEVKKEFSIKNIGTNPITLSLISDSAIDNHGRIECFLLTLNESVITIAPGSNYSILAKINFPDNYGGIFYGKLRINEGNNEFVIPYIATRLSKLKLSVEGEHFPNFLVYDHKNMEYVGGGSQDWDFQGNSYTMQIAAGEYSVYVINDFLVYGEADEYILSDIVNVLPDSESEKTFRLSDAREFTVKAESKEGEPLSLYEWTKGLTVYKNKYGFCRNYYLNKESCENNDLGVACYWVEPYCYEKGIQSTYSDPIIGDRKIYLSNSPDNGLSNDILLKYFGAPEDET